MKRHTALQPVSREHHTVLSFCFDLKKGMERQVPLTKLTEYIRWFWEHHLQKHFAFEEQYMFPIVSLSHPDVPKLLEQHSLIKELIFNKINTYSDILKIENLLEKHIRLEERKVFNEIQEKATEDQLNQITKQHRENPFCSLPNDFLD